MNRTDDKSLATDFDIFANLEAYDEDNASDTTAPYPVTRPQETRNVSFADFISSRQQTSMYFRPTNDCANPVRRRERDFDDFVRWYDEYYAPRVAESDDEAEDDIEVPGSPWPPSPEARARGRRRARMRSRSPYARSPPTLSRQTTGEFPNLTATSALRFTTTLIPESPQTSPLAPLNFDE